MERGQRKEGRQGRESRKFFKKPDRWGRLHALMRECDIVIEVADARDIYNTRLPKVENWAGKERLIIVANKADLVGGEELLDMLWERGFVPMRSKMQGNVEREKLLGAILAKRTIRPLRVAVIGYPNTGKSTIINLLAKRRAAQVAAIAGTTRGIQWIRVHPEIMLLDSAGIFPEKLSKSELFFRGAVNVDGLEDPENYAHSAMMEMLENDRARDWLCKHFDIEIAGNDSAEEVIGKIACRRNFLLRGGEPNTFEASRLFLRSLTQAPILLRGAHIPKEEPAEEQEGGGSREGEERHAHREGDAGDERQKNERAGSWHTGEKHGKRPKKAYEKRNRRHMGRR